MDSFNYYVRENKLLSYLDQYFVRYSNQFVKYNYYNEFVKILKITVYNITIIKSMVLTLNEIVLIFMASYVLNINIRHDVSNVYRLIIYNKKFSVIYFGNMET